MSIALAASLAFYLPTLALCLHAARLAGRYRPDRGERVPWALCAASVMVLFAVRMTGAEEALRAGIRASAMDTGAYALRTSWQAPLSAMVIVLLAVAGFFAFRLWRRFRRSRPRQLLLLAAMALVGFCLLYALRLMSFHATDVLLYSGPVRLNWLIEGGLLCVIGAAAFLYGRICRDSGGHADPRQSRGARR